MFVLISTIKLIQSLKFFSQDATNILGILKNLNLPNWYGNDWIFPISFSPLSSKVIHFICYVLFMIQSTFAEIPNSVKPV